MAAKTARETFCFTRTIEGGTQITALFTRSNSRHKIALSRVFWNGEEVTMPLGSLFYFKALCETAREELERIDTHAAVKTVIRPAVVVPVSTYAQGTIGGERHINWLLRQTPEVFNREMAEKLEANPIYAEAVEEVRAIYAAHGPAGARVNDPNAAFVGDVDLDLSAEMEAGFIDFPEQRVQVVHGGPDPTDEQRAEDALHHLECEVVELRDDAGHPKKTAEQILRNRHADDPFITGQMIQTAVEELYPDRPAFGRCIF